MRYSRVLRKRILVNSPLNFIVYALHKYQYNYTGIDKYASEYMI